LGGEKRIGVGQGGDRRSCDQKGKKSFVKGGERCRPLLRISINLWREGLSLKKRTEAPVRNGI